MRFFAVIAVVIVLFASASLALVNNWPLTTLSNYTYDANQIELGGGGAKLIQIDQTDSDNTSTGFGGGTLSNIAWSTDHLGLSSGQTAGSFESRVMDSFGSVSWSSLSWVPRAPYLKELPNNGSSESGYTEGNFDMTDCVLLLHMNEDPAEHGATLTDYSGRNTSAILYTSDFGTNKSVTGKINKAIRFDGTNDYVAISPPAPSTVVSAVAWFKRVASPSAKFHVILGSGNVELSAYDDGTLAGSSGKLRVGITTNTAGRQMLTSGSSGQLFDGNWHMIGLIYDGSLLKAFIDGVQTGERSLSGTISGASNYIGRFSGGYFANNEIDEVAIWNRALSPTEMLNYYKRSAVRLKYQVRSGSANPPAGNFVGPDGTTSTYYSELNNATFGISSNISLSGVQDNRYFQYKTFFETDNSSYAPELSSVTVGPNHYSSGNPSIQPLSSLYQGFQTIGSITETAVKDGGEIKYTLSNDQGTTWRYWNSTSSSWETSDSTYTQSNTTAEINSNVISYPIGEGKLLFRAFLHSNGTQEVRLDNVSAQYFMNTPEVVSRSPSNGETNVGVGGGVTVVFSHTMDQGSVGNAFSMAAIKNNSNQATNESVGGTFSWPNVRTVTFEPSAELKKGYLYQVIVSTEAKTVNNFSLASSEAWNFRVIMDHEKINVYESDDGKSKVEVGAGALGQDGYVTINRDPVNNPTAVSASAILDANTKAIGEGNAFHYPLTASITELNAYDTGGTRITSNFNSPVALTLYYTDADNDGYVDSASPPIKGSDLLLYWLDETNRLWIRVPGSAVNTSSKAVSASVLHFSTYTLMATPALDLSLAYAFPVPYKPSAGHNRITFTNLASVCTIRIYTISGNLVAALEETDGDGQLSWNVTNTQGSFLASGVYVYHIKSAGDSKVGKIIVIR